MQARARRDAVEPVLPRRVALDADDPASVFQLLRTGHDEGLAGALLTIVRTEGGGRRPVGTQMAVLEDGRYCGYLSGGCVEAAAAAEAILAMAQGRSTTIHFGRGSPFLDIVLPCGGAIHIRIDVGVPRALIRECMAKFANRVAFTLTFRPTGVTLLTDDADEAFTRHYEPATRLLLIGEGPELEALARMARAARWPVQAMLTRPQSDADAMREIGVDVSKEPAEVAASSDPFTAVVVCLHDRQRETEILLHALSGPAFFIGAMGSTRTQARRLEDLARLGMSSHQLNRLHGPVGTFGPARDAASFAISVVAQIAQTRQTMVAR